MLSVLKAKFLSDHDPKLTKTLTGHTGAINSLLVISESELASASADNSIKIWSLVTYECIQTLNGHEDSVLSLAFDQSTSTLISGGVDCDIKLWRQCDSEEYKCCRTLRGYQDSVSCLVVLLDDLSSIIISGSWDTKIKLWSMDQTACTLTMLGHQEPISALALPPNNINNEKFLVSGSRDRLIKIWSLMSSSCIRTLQGHEDTVSSLVFKTNHLFLSGSWDGGIRLWDLNSSECLAHTEKHNQINSLVWHSETNSVIAGSLMALLSLKLDDTKPNEFKIKSQIENQSIKCLASTQSHIYAGCLDKSIKIWTLS